MHLCPPCPRQIKSGGGGTRPSVPYGVGAYGIIVENFKKIAQRTAELLRFNFFLRTFKPTIVNGTMTVTHAGHL